MSREVDRADRDAEALALRRQGLDYRSIARRVGVNVSTAHDRVKRALNRVFVEDAEHLREIECDRLDLALVVAMRVLHADPPVIAPPAMDEEEGNRWVTRTVREIVERRDVQLRAALVVVRISESRRTLLGLDAPARTEAGGFTPFTILMNTDLVTGSMARPADGSP
jgi:hypothetical protein